MGTRDGGTEDGLVVVTGVFDLLNVGQLRFLQAERQLGARLVGGVESDVLTWASLWWTVPTSSGASTLMHTAVFRISARRRCPSPLALRADLAGLFRMTFTDIPSH